jgi:hypothetical protein
LFSLTPKQHQQERSPLCVLSCGLRTLALTGREERKVGKEKKRRVHSSAVALFVKSPFRGRPAKERKRGVAASEPLVYTSLHPETRIPLSLLSVIDCDGLVRIRLHFLGPLNTHTQREEQANANTENRYTYLNDAAYAFMPVSEQGRSATAVGRKSKQQTKTTLPDNKRLLQWKGKANDLQERGGEGDRSVASCRPHRYTREMTRGKSALLLRALQPHHN